jgi:hypothetical protein
MFKLAILMILLYVELLKCHALVVHYLETRSFCCHAIHILCSAQTLILLVVLLQRKDKNLC